MKLLKALWSKTLGKKKTTMLFVPSQNDVIVCNLSELHAFEQQCWIDPSYSLGKRILVSKDISPASCKYIEVTHLATPLGFREFIKKLPSENSTSK